MQSGENQKQQLRPVHLGTWHLLLADLCIGAIVTMAPGIGAIVLHLHRCHCHNGISNDTVSLLMYGAGLFYLFAAASSFKSCCCCRYWARFSLNSRPCMADGIHT